MPRSTERARRRSDAGQVVVGERRVADMGVDDRFVVARARDDALGVGQVPGSSVESMTTSEGSGVRARVASR